MILSQNLNPNSRAVSLVTAWDLLWVSSVRAISGFVYYRTLGRSLTLVSLRALKSTHLSFGKNSTEVPADSLSRAYGTCSRSAPVSRRSACTCSPFRWVSVFSHLFSRGSSSNRTLWENYISGASSSGSRGQVFKDKKTVEESEQGCVEIFWTPGGL